MPLGNPTPNGFFWPREREGETLGNLPVKDLTYCLGAAIGSLQVPTALPLSWQLVVGLAVAVLRAAQIWWTVLHKWLLTALTLERLSFADGIVLARTWSPTVSKQPALLCPFPSSEDATELPSLTLLVLLVDSTGTMTNPRGRRGMQDGSSPLIASWIDSTSTVVYTTRLPDWSVQLSCSISSTCCDELLATCMHAKHSHHQI